MWIAARCRASPLPASNAATVVWQFSLDDGTTLARRHGAHPRTAPCCCVIPIGSFPSRHAQCHGSQFRLSSLGSQCRRGRQASPTPPAPGRARRSRRKRTRFRSRSRRSTMRRCFRPGITALTPLNEDYISNTRQHRRRHSRRTRQRRGRQCATRHRSHQHRRRQRSLAVLAERRRHWITMAPFAVDTGLLLRDPIVVRFLPDSENATTASFDFRAWDRTSGTAGNVASSPLPVMIRPSPIVRTSRPLSPTA